MQPTRGLLSPGGPISTLGTECFVAAGPKQRNDLPGGVRQPEMGYEQFEQLLKTSAFGC